MHVGSLTCDGGENVSSIPDACATHSFTYLARGPWIRYRTETYIKSIISFQRNDDDICLNSYETGKKLDLNFGKKFFSGLQLLVARSITERLNSQIRYLDVLCFMNNTLVEVFVMFWQMFHCSLCQFGSGFKLKICIFHNIIQINMLYKIRSDNLGLFWTGFHWNGHHWVGSDEHSHVTPNNR